VDCYLLAANQDNFLISNTLIISKISPHAKRLPPVPYQEGALKYFDFCVTLVRVVQALAISLMIGCCADEKSADYCSRQESDRAEDDETTQHHGQAQLECHPACSLCQTCIVEEMKELQTMYDRAGIDFFRRRVSLFYPPSHPHPLPPTPQQYPDTHSFFPL
jgi:hypothetical protein